MCWYWQLSMRLNPLTWGWCQYGEIYTWDCFSCSASCWEKQIKAVLEWSFGNSVTLPVKCPGFNPRTRPASFWIVFTLFLPAMSASIRVGEIALMQCLLCFLVAQQPNISFRFSRFFELQSDVAFVRTVAVAAKVTNGYVHNSSHFNDHIYKGKSVPLHPKRACRGREEKYSSMHYLKSALDGSG